MIRQVTRITGAFLLLLPLLSMAEKSESYRVLPEGFGQDKTQQMMRAWQRIEVHKALDSRLKELEAALQSPESLAAYQKKRQEFLKNTFGPIHSPAELNVEITGTIREPGFTIEKILYDSAPGFKVTANLYRPEADGPFPGILLPCGHSANGKAYESYQKACRLLVKNGFVVLCFDPIGQGERRQLIGPDKHPLIRPTGEHNEIGVAPILLGSNLANYMIRDGVKGIDYLCSRPDVDPKRIGCTGNSGGGNLTSFLMAYDDRITAAAPGCFMTTHRRKNESPGPGDAEQNLFAQIRQGFDHPDFIIGRAPKPTLILSATRDFVPIEGTWEAYRQAKRIYTSLGHPERLELIEANDKHGFSKSLREGAVRFFARWLQNRNIEVFEEQTVDTLSDEELQVTPDGQTLWMKDALSIFDLNQRHYQVLKKNQPKLTAEIVRDITGIKPLDEIPLPKVETVDDRKLIFTPEPGIVLPGLHWRAADLPPVLIVPGEGMNSCLERARILHSKGHPVLIIEARDTGETKTRNWRFYGADSYIGQMLGRSWLAMRTEDILNCCRWLSEKNEGRKIIVEANGETGPAALHAGYLEPQLIETVKTESCLSSWADLITERNGSAHIHQAVHGALKFYDLPDLIKN